MKHIRIDDTKEELIEIQWERAHLEKQAEWWYFPRWPGNGLSECNLPRRR